VRFLVDTNIFSEPVKPKPDPKIVGWLREHEGGLHVSTITVGELRRGIERLPNGRRRTQLRAWLGVLGEKPSKPNQRLGFVGYTRAKLAFINSRQLGSVH
jgi:predicted nucleic acid-binding protein